MRLYRVNCDKEDATAARLKEGAYFTDRYLTRRGNKRAKVMVKDIDIARQYRSRSSLPPRYWHDKGEDKDPFEDDDDDYI